MSVGKRDYDVIIAGGGLAGMITACSVAFYSNQSLRVLVIDRNPLSSLGRKTITGWICGDAVGKKAVDYMSNRIGIRWESPEIEHNVKGVVAYSPDHETAVSFDGEGYLLNRKVLPQKQLNDAVDLGIEIKDKVALRSLIFEDNMIVGILGEELDSKTVFKRTAKLVIDCTGVTSVLRANLPIQSYIEKRINRNDLEATGRYIYTFDIAKQDRTYFDRNYCIIHLDQEIAPGGYAWVFPKGQNKANIGLGVQQKALESMNKRNGTNKDLKSLIDEYVLSNPVLKDLKMTNEKADEGNSWGTWQVSVRRQNDCLVAKGYMVVGDAAWMPKPIDAGGIGPAIIASTIVGKDAVEAIQQEDVTERGLWKYSKDFMNEYGYKTAGLEVFRRMLQGLSNDQINYGMKHFLSKMDVEKITNGEHPEFSAVDKLSMFIRGVVNKTLAENLSHTSKMNEKLVNHYHNYPEDPGGFPQWHLTLEHILNEAFAKFRN
ncbi:MAG TPA: NAD(P)/FAD-dependent oxidoreductase [Nitrososphaeraceae archaeon]|nr:NAD(P)/FAD-dependent oxidoreductase [Nitrososphaeraceae archaeon]